ncbi:hypothetical protein [Providencia sneebia]|uniref:Uncharacterized protein n=1 Tax=Providencia sneebia DSM 19967 TaxID=1141660 RepID=K8W9I9_9GAMM|nr:hypothetical protein [Providencia sneebia]EKT57318.1 hypothetical protein OO7_08015 [Providencia sneebia DSM 19967]
MKISKDDIIILINEHYPNLIQRIEHFDIETTENTCSVRLWMANEDLPKYLIFDKEEGKLHLSHGI